MVDVQFMIDTSRSSQPEIPPAQVIGGPIAATLLLLDGKAGLYGWQWLFILVGCPTVLFGGLIKVPRHPKTGPTQ